MTSGFCCLVTVFPSPRAPAGPAPARPAAADSGDWLVHAARADWPDSGWRADWDVDRGPLAAGARRPGDEGRSRGRGRGPRLLAHTRAPRTELAKDRSKRSAGDDGARGAGTATARAALRAPAEAGPGSGARALVSQQQDRLRAELVRLRAPATAGRAVRAAEARGLMSGGRPPRSAPRSCWSATGRCCWASLQDLWIVRRRGIRNGRLLLAQRQPGIQLARLLADLVLLGVLANQRSARRRSRCGARCSGSPWCSFPRCCWWRPRRSTGCAGCSNSTCRPSQPERSGEAWPNRRCGTGRRGIPGVAARGQPPLHLQAGPGHQHPLRLPGAPDVLERPADDRPPGALTGGSRTGCGRPR